MTTDTHEMGAHTPEPWTADIPYIHAGDTATNIGECFVNDGIGADQMWANTRRIAACVNACKGISNERLDEMAEEDRYFGRALISKEAYAEMERQRDELLAALEEAEMYYQAMLGKKLCPHKNSSCGACHDSVLRLRRAAIANARNKEIKK